MWTLGRRDCRASRHITGLYGEATRQIHRLHIDPGKDAVEEENSTGNNHIHIQRVR